MVHTCERDVNFTIFSFVKSKINQGGLSSSAIPSKGIEKLNIVICFLVFHTHNDTQIPILCTTRI